MNLNLNEHGALKPLWLEMSELAIGIIEHKHQLNNVELMGEWNKSLDSLCAGLSAYIKNAHKYRALCNYLMIDSSGLPYYKRLCKIWKKEYIEQRIAAGK